MDAPRNLHEETRRAAAAGLRQEAIALLEAANTDPCSDDCDEASGLITAAALLLKAAIYQGDAYKVYRLLPGLGRELGGVEALACEELGPVLEGMSQVARACSSAGVQARNHETLLLVSADTVRVVLGADPRDKELHVYVDFIVCEDGLFVPVTGSIKFSGTCPNPAWNLESEEGLPSGTHERAEALLGRMLEFLRGYLTPATREVFKLDDVE